MTDPKLPPLPHPVMNAALGDDWHDLYTADQMNAHWLDGYRAGQSSAEPMTEEEATKIAMEIWQGKGATRIQDIAAAVIEASRRAPVADQRAVPGWITSTVQCAQCGAGIDEQIAAEVTRRAEAHAAAPTPPAGERWVSPTGRVRYIRCETAEEARASTLYSEGDMVHVWVNEGDLAMYGDRWPTPPKGGQEP